MLIYRGGLFLKTRAPDKLCFENTRHLSKLTGARLSEMSKKEIAGLAGGYEG